MKILHFHGIHNLGDIVFNFIIFYNIKQYLEENNITIYFYMRNEHIEQMNDFKPIKGMKIFDISKKPSNSIELWDCNDYIFEPNGKKNNHSKIFSGFSQNLYYVKYFNIRLKKLNIPITISNFCYEDPDLLIRYEKLDNKFKNLDILFVNSDAQSGQYNYDEKLWKYAINILNSRYKIVTTKKIDENIISTRDDNLNIKDIAAISTHVKVVIAINTGVFTGFLNKYTLNNVNKFYIFDNRTYYNYPKFENKKFLRDISLEELDKFII
jgi:hypothetical protein